MTPIVTVIILSGLRRLTAYLNCGIVLMYARCTLLLSLEYALNYIFEKMSIALRSLYMNSNAIQKIDEVCHHIVSEYLHLNFLGFTLEHLCNIATIIWQRMVQLESNYIGDDISFESARWVALVEAMHEVTVFFLPINTRKLIDEAN